MTREELRKKRQEIAKNNGYSEYKSKKYSQQPVTTQETSESTVMPRVTTNQVSTWDKVQNKLNQTMTAEEYNKKYNIASKVGNDVTQTVKNAVLGGASGLVSALGQTEFLSQQKNPEYRRAQAHVTKVNEQKDLKTPVERFNYENKNLEKATRINGILVEKQPDINESATMRVFNRQQEAINKMIEENTEQAQTKLGKFYAGQVAPSMGQSLVGTGLDIVAPRHGCWI